jgi:hypothetical protein
MRNVKTTVYPPVIPAEAGTHDNSTRPSDPARQRSGNSKRTLTIAPLMLAVGPGLRRDDDCGWVSFEQGGQRTC